MVQRASKAHQRNHLRLTRRGDLLLNQIRPDPWRRDGIVSVKLLCMRSGCAERPISEAWGALSSARSHAAFPGETRPASLCGMSYVGIHARGARGLAA